MRYIFDISWIFFITSFKPSIDEDEFELKQGSSAYGKDW